MRPKALIASLLMTLLLLAISPTSGAQGKPFQMVFSPQWTAMAQFAGYYVALDKGFYDEVGLDVKIVHPSVTQGVMEKINNGLCDVTTMPLSVAIKAFDDGVRLVNILQTSMNSAAMLISRRGTDPMNMPPGSKVLCLRAGLGLVSRCITQKMGLDYEWVEAASCINLFVAGAVDATASRSFHEYYQLLQTGLVDPDGPSVYRFSDHGYNIQQDGLYVTRNFYRKHPKESQAFAQASRRGWEWCAEHPEEALEIVMEHVEASRISTNRTLQKLMLEEVLRLQVDKDSGVREFRLRPDMVQTASELMHSVGMIEREVTIKDLLP